jgi:glycerol kinase
MGAAYLAGLAVGFWKDQSMIAERRKINRKFTPVMNEDKRKALYDNWKKAVGRAMHWEEEKEEEK